MGPVEAERADRQRSDSLERRRKGGNGTLEQSAVVVGVCVAAQSGTRRARQLSLAVCAIDLCRRTESGDSAAARREVIQYRQISSDPGVALGSITNIKQRLEAHQAAIVAAARHSRRGDALPSQLALRHALSDRPRIGGGRRSTRDSSPICQYAREPRLYLSEACQLFERRFGVRVAPSTMCRFLRADACRLTRQRVQKQLPVQALSEKNTLLRRQFVANWVRGADHAKIGTNDEQPDRLQQSGHRGVASVDQPFWIDETGCNRHTLL